MKKALWPALLIGVFVMIALLWVPGHRSLQAEEEPIATRVTKLEKQYRLLYSLFKLQERNLQKKERRLKAVETMLGITEKPEPRKSRPPERRKPERPDRPRTRADSNEANAIGQMKTLSAGQEQFKAACRVDQNDNGVGEYGFLEELGGLVQCRDSTNRQEGDKCDRNPYIPTFLGNTDTLRGTGTNDISERCGYYFRLYLPKGAKEAVSTCPEKVDIALAESAFVVYAWPKETGVTGSRVFVLDPRGRIYAWANTEKTYSGTENMPAWYTAFNTPDWTKAYIDEYGPGQTGVKGSQWILVN
jgi:hypothetical protein